MREIIHKIGNVFLRLGLSTMTHNDEQRRAHLKSEIHRLRLDATCEMLGAMHSYRGRISDCVSPYGSSTRANVLFATADDLERTLALI